MPLLQPTKWLRRITQITPEMLCTLSVRALLLDVDNTLTTHNNPVADPHIAQWLELMRKNGIPMMIISNNKPARVKAFANALELPFTASAKKPLGVGFRRAAAKLNVRPSELAVVGDQLFTDVLGGNLFGAVTILVEPMEPEDMWFFRLKRRFERVALSGRQAEEETR